MLGKLSVAHRDVILIEGDIPFDSIKYVTDSEFDN